MPQYEHIKNIALVYPVASLMPPLGLLTLASLLEKTGKTVLVAPIFIGEYETGDEALPDQLFRLREFAPDLVGMGFMSADRFAARAAMDILKSNLPKAIFVLGGRHPSCFPQDMLDWGSDFVIVGEGENALLELVNCLENNPDKLREVEGLAYRDNEGFHFLPRPKETADLDIMPAYHLIPYQAFINMRSALIGRYIKSGWLSTSRGCFSRCIYCRDINFGGHLRFRSMDAIEKDMRFQLEHYDLDCFYIIDDMFAVNTERVLEFCRIFKKLKRDFKKKLYFAATARTDTLNNAMVKAMADAGCTQLSIGMESGSQRIHNFLQTGKKVETIIPAFKMLKNTRIDTFVNLIVGVPFEQEDDIQKTYDLLEFVRPTIVGSSYLTAYPGTPLFDMAIKNCWLNEDVIRKTPFKHSTSAVQLDIQQDEEIICQRKRLLLKKNIFRNIFSIVRRPDELFHLSIDTIAFLFVRPKITIKMIICLLTRKVEDFLKYYRHNIMIKAGLYD